MYLTVIASIILNGQMCVWESERGTKIDTEREEIHMYMFMP